MTALGVPGVGAAVATQSQGILLTQNGRELMVKASIADGANIRDIRSTPSNIMLPGMILGKITASGKLGSAIIGKTLSDYTSGTSLALTVATAVELNRRVGASGTFKLVGGALSATPWEQTITYSAVNTTTGVATITDPDTAAVNEVQTITADGAMTAGVLAITYYAPNGDPIVVSVPWNTDWATTMGNWNTASVAAATAWYGGASNGAVMTGTATVPILTFSGAGFSGAPIPYLAEADVDGCTGWTYATVDQTTAGVSAVNITAKAGALILPEDGSQMDSADLMIAGEGDGSGIKMVDEDGNDIDQTIPELVVGGYIRTARLYCYPGSTYTGLIAWYKSKLRAAGQHFLFDDDFV